MKGKTLLILAAVAYYFFSMKKETTVIVDETNSGFPSRVPGEGQQFEQGPQQFLPTEPLNLDSL